MKPDDIQAALKTQGVSPLTDTQGIAYAASAVWDASGPDAIIQYILSLAARKGASDVQIEPKEDAVSVKYRIDGFFFRLDAIPKAYQSKLTQKLVEVFRLDPAKETGPRRRAPPAGCGTRLRRWPRRSHRERHVRHHQALNRSTFLKDFATPVPQLEDRVRLSEELRRSFGLVLVTAPVFQRGGNHHVLVMNSWSRGSGTWSPRVPGALAIEGARQVEVETDAAGSRGGDAPLPMIAVAPGDRVSSVPDAGRPCWHAARVEHLGGTIRPRARPRARGAPAARRPADVLSGSLSAVLCQRLIRQICRSAASREGPAAPDPRPPRLSPEEAATLQFFKGKGCPTCNKVGTGEPRRSSR